MDDLRELLELTASIAADFYETLPERPVFPRGTHEELHEALGGPLPQGPTPARNVIAELAAAADSGLVAEPSGRYFGFVIGGSTPASLAADWLASAWDQNAVLYVSSPAASVVEEIAGAWLLELLGLPAQSSVGFVTGAQMANFTALAAARHHVLAAAGWDVERDGLTGAPKIDVIVGANRHGTLDRALWMLGLGRPTNIVPADDNGRMLAQHLSVSDAPTIICAQAGEVNTGASDPFHAIADARDAAANAWIHVDGAFGLWAQTSESLRDQVAGVERADSWSTDAHKWLNVPVRLGARLHRASGVAQRGVLAARGLPRRVRGARRARLEPGVVTPRTRVPDLCRDPGTRPRGRFGDGRALLHTCARVRRRAARARC